MMKEEVDEAVSSLKAGNSPGALETCMAIADYTIDSNFFQKNGKLNNGRKNEPHSS